MNTLLKTVGKLFSNSTSSNKTMELETKTEKTIVERTVKIARTRTGAPCLWESYSEFDNLTRATIIADAAGNIKKSLFVKNAKNKQALVPIQVGDVIVKAFRDKIGIAISILEIKSLSSEKNEAQIIPIFRKPSDDDKMKLPDTFVDAISEATMKLESPDKVCSKLEEKS